MQLYALFQFQNARFRRGQPRVDLAFLIRQAFQALPAFRGFFLFLGQLFLQLLNAGSGPGRRRETQNRGQQRERQRKKRGPGRKRPERGRRGRTDGRHCSRYG